MKCKICDEIQEHCKTFNYIHSRLCNDKYIFEFYKYINVCLDCLKLHVYTDNELIINEDLIDWHKLR